MKAGYKPPTPIKSVFDCYCPQGSERLANMKAGYKHRKYALAYNQFSRMYWLRTEEFYLAKQAQDFFYELYLKYINEL